MQPLRAITIEFNLKDSLTSMFNSYIGITAKSMDKIVAQSLTNVFATNVHYQQNNAPVTVYNNFDVAFAVGLTFKLIVEQDIELFEYIDQICSPQANEKQKYALQLLKFTIYQLDKREPATYLNNILANKYIPAQALDNKGINLSKLYTFVHLCELGAIFKQIQGIIKFKFWNSFQNQDVNEAEIQDALLFFYQPSAAFPILVLIKENFDEIQSKVFVCHTIFIKNIAIQLLLDSMSKVPLSQTTENLKIQPFRFKNIEELAIIIFQGQPKIEESIAKFIKIPAVDKTLGFLIVPNVNYHQQFNQLKADQEPEEIIQQNQVGSGQGAAQFFDPFKTYVPQTQTNSVRITNPMQNF